MAAWDFMRVSIPVAEDMGYGRGIDSGEDELGEIKTEEVLEVDFDYRSVSASGSAAWSTTTTTVNTERHWEGNRRKKRRP